jgi:hypothetical protein
MHVSAGFVGWLLSFSQKRHAKRALLGIGVGAIVCHGSNTVLEVQYVEEKIDDQFRGVALKGRVVESGDFSGFQLVGDSSGGFLAVFAEDVEFDDGGALPVGECAQGVPSIAIEVADEFVEQLFDRFVHTVCIQLHFEAK